jgi:ribosomal protein L9
MKVIAITAAFYNGSRVRKGDTVEVPEGYRASWFAKVASPEAKAAVKPAKASRETPRALSQAGKEEAKTFVQAHSEKADLA